MENKYLTKNAGMCYSEILILIVAMFAFSYIYSDSSEAIEEVLGDLKNSENVRKDLIMDQIIEKSLEKQKKEQDEIVNNFLEYEENQKSFFDKIIEGIIDRLNRPLLGSVSAEDLNPADFVVHCCEESDGVLCQDYPASDIEQNCDRENIVPVACDNNFNCKQGCCYNSEEGTCAISRRKGCEAGEFDEGDISCTSSRCQKSCCVLGSRIEFTTAKNCEWWGDMLGVEEEFKPEITTEQECLILVEAEIEGACVFSEGNCKFITGSECYSLGGNFNSQKLCSNSVLGTICTKQNYTGCVSGKDEVYWFDSCGNRENIYSSDLDESWNNGMVLAKVESCGVDSEDANVNSDDCGNCLRYVGSICSEESGEAVCKDLNCHNVLIRGEEVTKRNGESWCVYDGAVGVDFDSQNPFSRDVVGSRHWKYYCENGEVKSNPCLDYRNQVCIQGDQELDNGGIFSSANCIANPWQNCLAYNTQGETASEHEEALEECDENPFCYVKSTYIDTKFYFNTCTPKYPPGFDFGNSAEQNSGQTNENICSMATQSCQIIKVKRIGKDKKINTHCSNANSVKLMNEWCVSLGDCGAYVNYEGDFSTEGFAVNNFNLGELLRIWGNPAFFNQIENSYLRNAEPIAGEKIESGEVVDYLVKKGYLSSALGISESDFNDGGKVAGAMGKIGMGLTAGVFAVSVVLAGGNIALATTWVAGLGAASSAGTSALGAICGPLMAFGIALGLTAIIGSLLGFSADTMWVSMAFALVGTAAILLFTKIGFIAGGFIGAAIGVAIGALLKFGFGIGDVSKKSVHFQCLPWKPEFGAENCDLCNQGEMDSEGDLLQQCSEYRCKSLGLGCEFVNENSDNPLCVPMQDDGLIPLISFGGVSNDFEFRERDSGVEISDSGECLPENTAFSMGIETENKPSICRYSFEDVSFDEMGSSYFGSSLLLYNHTLNFMAPSVASLVNQYQIPTETIIEKYGDLKLYVRCKDAYGKESAPQHIIKMCIKKGRDTDAPYVKQAFPLSGGYVKRGVEEQELKIWMNEPAYCRWGTDEFAKYDDMQDDVVHQMDCETSIESALVCNTTLTGLENGENKFYIRCKDNPWYFPENESLRNAMESPFEYVLNVAEFDLKIDSLKVKDSEGYGDEFFTGNDFMVIDLEVETSGGIDNGKAVCSYEAYGNLIPFEFTSNGFLDVWTNRHRQTGFSLYEGEHNISVECKDIAGNVAEDSVSFTISVDNTGPTITRMYYDAGSLKIMTSEEGKCEYSEDDEEWEEMMGLGKEHTVYWDADKTYYIKCEDGLGNQGGKKVVGTLKDL